MSQEQGNSPVLQRVVILQRVVLIQNDRIRDLSGKLQERKASCDQMMSHCERTLVISKEI